MTARAVVLLSGGLDSTVALHWADRRFTVVRALTFDYGQPAADREVILSSQLCEILGLPWEVVHFHDVLRGGLLDRVHDHATEPDAEGVNRACVPARNVVFLSVAASRAARVWPLVDFSIVIGACKEDVGGFPDCRPQFFVEATSALSAAIGRRVQVVAPFVNMSKATILLYAKQGGREVLADALRSWSCYRNGATPCNHCTACVTRNRAIVEMGERDACEEIKILTDERADA